MNVRLTVAAAISATGLLVALAAAASATDSYQDVVRQTLRDAGYEVPDTTGATTVLNQARDLVCQNRNGSTDVIDTQIQQAGWFNHPSLNRQQAEAIRTVALNYCPNYG